MLLRKGLARTILVKGRREGRLRVEGGIDAVHGAHSASEMGLSWSARVVKGNMARGRDGMPGRASSIAGERRRRGRQRAKEYRKGDEGQVLDEG